MQAVDIARLQTRFLEAFEVLTSKEAKELSGLLSAEALKRGFTYQRAEGVLETINLMLLPSFVMPGQVEYLNRLALAVKRGMDAICCAWQNDEALRKILPFSGEEEPWIRLGCRGLGQPLWYRLDCHFHMKDPQWLDKIEIFEINACAVGGVHYSPVADSMFLDIILPYLRKRLTVLPHVERNPDLRVLLYGIMARHAKAIGRRSLNIVYSEDTLAAEGITEGPNIVEFWKASGINATIADPRELYIKEGEVYYNGEPVDVMYRNFELADIIEMERQGADLSALRLAFSKNQAVSTLCGDFDHKSMWEALSGGEFDRYFSHEDAALFKKHLLWTRVVRERNTAGPEGFAIDLLPYALRNKDRLVLKPNRLCGGYGVTIGPDTEQKDWERLIDEALKEEGGWVLQKYSAPEEFVFPLFEKGSLIFERHNIVYGLTASVEGTGLLGRVSRQGVVNVAQQGGLMTVFRPRQEEAP